MTDHPPSLYEVLLGNFSGELDLHRVNEQEQHVLSVLDNLQRIFNSRAGGLAHLPDLGLPDMGQVMQSVAPAANGVLEAMHRSVNAYEPRLCDLNIEPVAQDRPGHLEYILQARLKNGEAVTFGTSLGSGGRVLIRHLKQQDQARSTR